MTNEAGRDQKDLAMWRHDVRNKLNIISGYTALMRLDDLTHDQNKFLEEIEDAAKEMASLVDAMRERVLRGEPSTGEDVRLDE